MPDESGKYDIAGAKTLWSAWPVIHFSQFIIFKMGLYVGPDARQDGLIAAGLHQSCWPLCIL